MSFSIAALVISAYPGPATDVARHNINSRPAVLAAVNTPTPTPTPGPTPTPTPAPAARKNAPAPVAATGKAFGIAAGSELAQLSPAALNQKIAAMKATGVTWVRYDIEWSNIEYAGPGHYNWADYDRVVHAVSAAGLKSLAIIDYTPAWARSSSCRGTAMCAPADPAAFGHFAAAAATRYRPHGVRAWEIWNEPNNLNYFQPGANPAAYTALLKSAYSSIKSVDPGATILTAGTSPAGDGGGYMSPPNFLRGIYAAGGRGYFDAVAHHPYTFPFTPTNAYPGGPWSQLTDMRNIMVANGDGAKKLWITEYGAPTGGPDPTAAPGQWPLEGGWQVNESLQAILVADAIQAYRKYSWVGPFFWYSLQDGGTDHSTAENFFGLLRHDGSRKPAYDAFIKAIR